MIIGYSEIKINETQKARKVYQSIEGYSSDKSNKDVQKVDFNGDNINYKWEEFIIQLENTCVKLLLNHPNERSTNKPRIAKLCIKVFGEKQARQSSIRRLEEIAEEKFS